MQPWRMVRCTQNKQWDDTARMRAIQCSEYKCKHAYKWVIDKYLVLGMYNYFVQDPRQPRNNIYKRTAVPIVVAHSAEVVLL